jgi:hypothetical protein
MADFSTVIADPSCEPIVQRPNHPGFTPNWLVFFRQPQGAEESDRKVALFVAILS